MVTAGSYFTLKAKPIIVVLVIMMYANLSGQDTLKYDLNSYLDRIGVLVSEFLVNNRPILDKQFLLDKKQNGSGIDKVDSCLELFKYFVYKSTDSAKKHNDQARQLSQELGYKKGYLQSLANQGFIHFILGDFENTMKTISELEVEQEINDYPLIREDVEILRSYVYTERGEYPMALEIALGSLERGEALQKPYILMRSYSAISHVYLRLGDYEKALDNCLKGLDYVIDLQQIQYIFPKVDEIARMVHRLEGGEKAMQIYDFYLEIEEKISGPGSYIQSVVYMNIAQIYKEQGDLERAKEYLQTSLELINKNNYSFRKPRAHVAMAELSMQKYDTIGAIKSYAKALISAQNINAYDVIKNSSERLSDLYSSTGNKQVAYEYHLIHNKVNDSLFSTESEQKIKILEAQRQIGEILRQKEVLSVQKASQEQKYRFLLMISLLMVLLALLAGYSYYKVKMKNRLLFDRTKELTLEKSNKSVVGVAASSSGTSVNYKSNGTDEEYIDKDIKEIILTKLERLEGEKFYLNTKCNLSLLSDELQTNQKYLSLVINHEKKSNFNNYINGLRINHLLERLLEDKDFRNSKLSYIARASGFNNQNTFYAAFKKRLGILPSYFIRKLNEEEEQDQLV